MCILPECSAKVDRCFRFAVRLMYVHDSPLKHHASFVCTSPALLKQQSVREITQNILHSYIAPRRNLLTAGPSLIAFCLNLVLKFPTIPCGVAHCMTIFCTKIVNFLFLFTHLYENFWYQNCYLLKTG